MVGAVALRALDGFAARIAFPRIETMAYVVALGISEEAAVIFGCLPKFL